MRRSIVLLVAVALVAAVAFTAMAQREGQATGQRGGFANMTDEQRAQMRERWQNMSEEERAQMREQMRGQFGNMTDEQRAQMRGRFGARLSREDQLKAVAAIQEQAAKLKAVIEAQPERGSMANFQNMSDEERTKFREQMTKQRTDRMTALRAIETEMEKLQGARPERIGTARELERIVSVAKEEKATKTVAAIEAMIARAETRNAEGGNAAPEGGRPLRGRDRGARSAEGAAQN